MPEPALMAGRETTLAVQDYSLGATLDSGQVFRWQWREGAWEGVIGARWVRLREIPNSIHARTAVPVTDWSWLTHYLQTEVDLAAILRSFPDDEPLRKSVAACHGLRLLRQEPWECLASFIASSTKQIVQIRQIMELLCRRYGPPVKVPPGHLPESALAFAFPSPERLAACSEAELRACKLGFRAPYLLAAARRVASGELDLGRLGNASLADARQALLRLAGVGEKIAQCVLLFAYGFPRAFPVDVWVRRAIKELYFRGRRIPETKLIRFVDEHFGPQAGYAQQYLFHYMRRQQPRRPRIN